MCNYVLFYERSIIRELFLSILFLKKLDKSLRQLFLW